MKRSSLLFALVTAVALCACGVPEDVAEGSREGTADDLAKAEQGLCWITQDWHCASRPGDNIQSWRCCTPQTSGGYYCYDWYKKRGVCKY